MTSLLKLSDWTCDYFIANRSQCTAILEDSEALKEIPSINNGSLDEFRDRQLVRFEGMIQDMYDPEFYFQQYEVKNSETEACEVRCGMYTDTAKYLPGEEILFESKKNQTSERHTCIVISTPGLNDWAREKYEQSICLGTKALNINKRSLDDDGDNDSNNTNNLESTGKKVKTTSVENDEEVVNKESNIFSKEYILNFPIPIKDGKACIVKIYNDTPLKLNETIEIVGFISLDPLLNGVDDSDETMSETENAVHHPPASLVPRLHAIKIIRPTKLDLKIVPQIMSKVQSIRSDLHLILSQLLFGDSLAADFLICHLLSSIYMRNQLFTLGTYPLNITHFPFLKYKQFVKDLYKFLTMLTRKSHLLEITLENLNDLTLSPKKDYEGNRLTSGVLQLSKNTHLVIDETGLTTGQISQAGQENYSAIYELINYQKVTYDFKYYKLEYETDIPILILSEAKSFITCPTQVALKVEPESENIYPQILELTEHYLKDKDRVSNIRQYLEIARETKFEFSDDDVMKEIENDFVRLKEINKDADRMHSLMVLARLLSLSHGSSTLTVEHWKKAVQMELERISRLPGKK